MKPLGRTTVRMRWSILAEWWCVPNNMNGEEERSFLGELRFDGLVKSGIIRTRLYGGFKCEEEPGRIHVYFDTGAFTYLNPERNIPLTSEERLKQYQELLARDKVGFSYRGPFCEDMPNLVCQLPVVED